MVRTFPNEEDSINAIKDNISLDWVIYHIPLCFITPYAIIRVINKYLGNTYLITHITLCESIWKLLTNL